MTASGSRIANQRVAAVLPRGEKKNKALEVSHDFTW